MLTVECERPLLPKKVLEKVLTETASAVGLKKKRGFSLSFVSARTIRRLNREYRGQDKVTDVLSFPFDDKEMIGEILICFSEVEKQANRFGHSMEDEMIILLVHGVLHLFSFDHLKKEEARKMFPLQRKILKKLKIDWLIPDYG